MCCTATLIPSSLLLGHFSSCCWVASCTGAPRHCSCSFRLFLASSGLRIDTRIFFESYFLAICHFSLVIIRFRINAIRYNISKRFLADRCWRRRAAVAVAGGVVAERHNKLTAVMALGSLSESRGSGLRGNLALRTSDTRHTTHGAGSTGNSGLRTSH